MNGAARAENLVSPHAYGVYVQFGIRSGIGPTVVCRQTIGCPLCDRSLLIRALRAPPHRRSARLSDHSHFFQKTSSRETFPSSDTVYVVSGQERPATSRHRPSVSARRRTAAETCTTYCLIDVTA